MSCFSAELQALQLLFPKSVSGIAGALPSLSCYTSLNCRTRDVGLWCHFQTTYILFNDVKLGSIICVHMGREWPNLGGLAPHHTQRPPTYWDPFFPCPCQKVIEKPTQYSLLQRLPRKTFDRWYCHGHSQVLSLLTEYLAVHPPLPVTPHHDFWPTRVNV